MNTNANRQSYKDCWRSIANSEIETHWSVIDVAHFSEHSIKVNTIDSCPRECCQPRIVKTDGDKLAGELIEK